MRGHGIAGIMLGALLITLQGLSLPAAAQRAEVHTEEGPHYVDVPLRVQVIVEGFEETPQPEVEVDPPPGGRLDLTGVSPNVSTSIQIINGRMSQSKRVQFVYQYQFLADTPGSYVLGPFRISQEGTRVSTRPVPVQLGDIPLTSEQRLRLVLPEGPLIVGQRVPIRLEWWVPAQLRGKLFNPHIRVPLFERVDAFRFHDVPDPQADVALSIETPAGTTEFPATTTTDSRAGEQYLVRTVTRQMIPLQAGEFALAPAALVVDEAVRWRRSLFGDRIPTHAQKRRVEDEARTLLVQDLPGEGRPESFTGTVGRGFTLEVAADRSVVQVGDPIRLTVTLRGDAAVETAVLPPLTADGGLSERDFRLPQGSTAGVYEDAAKRFELTVRVLHEGVSAIPPLAFSWYDPELQAYQTTRSQPIALSVRKAQLVSAGDVVRGEARGDEDDTPTQEDQASVKRDDGTVAAQRRPVFTLSGADLAIVTDVDALLRPGGSLATGVGVQGAAYAAGLLVMALAVLARRRALADPADVARGKALQAQRATVARATTIIEASAALRRMIAVSGKRPPPELDAFLAECDEYAYAPGGASRQLDAPQRSRALQLADIMLGERVR